MLAAVDDDPIPEHRLLGVAHHALGPPPDPTTVPPEVERARADASRAERVEWLVVGTVVLEAALTPLRRLAQEHHSARRPAGRRRRR